MYDRSIKLYDEPHSPEALDRMVQSAHLNKGKFLTEAHHDSYFLQMATMHRLKVRSVLEIGPGESFAANYLKSLGVQYDTMDIVEQSNPTILGKLEDFDVKPHSASWEMVCAFQMLEHSPYHLFTENLRKMGALSKKYVFISLPYSCFGFGLSLNIMLGQRIRFQKRTGLYFPLCKKNRKYREEYMREFPWAVHYWEIGRRGFAMSTVRKDIESSGLRIIESFQSGNPYHYFFLTEKVDADG